MLRCLGISVVSFVALTSTIINPAFGAGVSFTDHTSAGQGTYLHGELNSDGREDFVYTLGQTTGGFAVVLSTGDGTYAPPQEYALPFGESAISVGIGDFNGDGKADLVVSGANDASQQYDLFVYVNDGTGMFTETTSLPLGNEVVDLAVGDFNHDGLMDVAFISGLDLNVWLGNGQSGFTPGPVTAVAQDGPMLLGDFDGDGYADIAISDLVNYDKVQVLFGDGKGDFSNQMTLQGPSGGHSLFGATDVNGDGKMDIVASTYFPANPNHVSVYYGDGSRTFASHTTIPIRHCASNTATPIAADMNGDGINDLVVPESDCNDNGQATRYVGVLTRNANSSYNSDEIVYTSPSASLILNWLSVIRGNADTKPDLAFAQCTAAPCSLQVNYDTHVLLNTSAGTFHSCDAPFSFTGINVCSPIAGSTVASAVPFHVGAAGQAIMRKIEVWVDGKKVTQQLNGFSNYSYLDETLSLTQGSHRVTIFAAGWDNWLEKKVFTLYVQ